MIHAYYRSSIWSSGLDYSKLKDYEYDDNFMSELSPEDALIGKQIYKHLLDLFFSEIKREKVPSPDKYYEDNKDVEIVLKDSNQDDVNCLLEFGEVNGLLEYQNATHSFYAYFTALQAIRLKRSRDEDYVVSKPLSDRFDSLILSGGANIGDDMIDEDYNYSYSVEVLTPEVSDLFAIRNGKSPRVAREEKIAEREAMEAAEKAAKEAEEAKEAAERAEREAEEQETIMDIHYEEKYGVAPRGRGHYKKENKDIDI